MTDAVRYLEIGRFHICSLARAVAHLVVCLPSKAEAHSDDWPFSVGRFFQIDALRVCERPVRSKGDLSANHDHCIHGRGRYGRVGQHNDTRVVFSRYTTTDMESGDHSDFFDNYDPTKPNRMGESRCTHTARTKEPGDTKSSELTDIFFF